METAVQLSETTLGMGCVLAIFGPTARTDALGKIKQFQCVVCASGGVTGLPARYFVLRNSGATGDLGLRKPCITKHLYEFSCSSHDAILCDFA